MDKIIIERAGKKLRVSRKTYDLIYKQSGYKELVTKLDISNELTVKELKELAKKRNIEGYSNMLKEELIEVLAGD